MKIPYSDQAYEAMIAALFVRFPSFGSVGAGAYKPGLERMEEMCRRLSNPQKKFRSIHVAGTNGKGSTCNMLAACFAASGMKTGLYTSPHILDFRERARIIESSRERASHGESSVTLIPRERVWDFVQSHGSDIDELNLSFFEITTVMAFDWFASCNIDIAVIETGLGGRLDATNVITPELSVITNIGYDHMDLLGPTLADIAGEKAGIIKAGVPVVIGESDPDTAPVFLRHASALSSPITFADMGGLGSLAENFLKPPQPVTRRNGSGLSKNILTSLADATRCDSEEHKCPSRSGCSGREHQNALCEPLRDPPTGGGPTRSVGGVPAGTLRGPSESSGRFVHQNAQFVDETQKNQGSSTKTPILWTSESSAELSDSSGGMRGMDLRGIYQEKNLNTVLTALEVLGKEPDMAAISHAGAICDFHGRWETLLENPKTICDIGHNEHGLKYNFRQLNDLLDSKEYTHLIMVYGSVSDKDVDAVLRILPQRAHIYFTAADNHRAMPAEELERRAKHPDAEIGGSVKESVRKALDRCEELRKSSNSNGALAKPLLYIGGSTYVVSEAVAYINNEVKTSTQKERQ